MSTQLEIELLEAFRKNPADAQVMIVKLTQASAATFHKELDDAIEIARDMPL